MVNILNNPSFEYWEGNYPDNWNKDENIGYNATIEKTESSHCGEYAIIVKGVKSENRRLTSQKICIDGITNKPGRYKLSAYINKSDTEGSAYIKMGYGIIINDAISSLNYKYSDTIEITSSEYPEDPYSYEFEITENCDICIIIMVQKSTPNSAYEICLDCIELVNLDDTTSEEPTEPETPSPTPPPTYLSIGLYFDAVTLSGNEISSTSNILTVNLPGNSADVSQIPKYKFIYNAVAVEHSCSVYCIYPFIIHYTINNVKYTLTSYKSTDNNYYMDLSCSSFNHGQTYNIVITVDDTNLDENTTINYVDKKLFYNLTAGNEKPFMYSGISNNSFGIVESATNKNYATLITHDKQIGVSYDDLLLHTNVGIPVLTSVQINALTSANKLPQSYIKINDTNSIYQRPENNSLGDTYVDQMFAAIRSLQAEVTKLRNTFKYGIESYQGKHTAMSSILGTDDTEPEEPMWAITEDSLSTLTDFEFKIGANHPLMNNNEGGTIEYDDDKLIVSGKGYYNETSFFSELNDAYIYFFLTVKNPNVKIRFKNLVNAADDKEIILDYNKLGIGNNVGKINIMVVLCRAHVKNIEAENKEYVGKNYLYTSINYWDSNKTIKDGYLSNIQNDNTLHTSEYLFSPDSLKEGIYYPYEVLFTDNEIYKFDAYSRYKDFSNTVLPTIPTTDENDRYKVAHLAIRACDTLEEAKSIKDQLLDNELLFITDKNKLYIKSKGNIVAISGAGVADDTDTGITDTTMTQQELIEMLMDMGIVYNDAEGSLSMSNLSGVTFTNEQTGKKFNFECDAYGELKGTEIRTDSIEQRLYDLGNEVDLSDDFANYRGAYAQLRLLEEKKDMLLSGDAGQCADRIKIGAVYCPLTTDKVFGATHGYIELVNSSNKDLNLEGCYLHYCFTDEKMMVQTASLPLTGVLPAGGSYLVRCKQYAEMNDTNAFIKVNTYDMEWYYNGKLIDLSIDPANTTNTYGFLLTYGKQISGANVSVTSECVKPIAESPTDTVRNSKDATYCYAKGFIDGICLVKKNGWGASEIPVKSNTIIKQTFMMDPAKQALNGLYGKDSSRIRWANNTNDIQYVNLDNEFISFKHSDEIYPVANFTPKASFEHKNVCTDKSKLNTQKPNMVYTAFGINNLTTRCFSWISVGSFNEYVWIKTEDENEFTILKRFESYKEISEEISMVDVCPRRKEFPVELNNAAYARIINRFPAENSLYCTHKCIVEVTNAAVTAPVKYEYIVGRADKDGNPDLLHCSDVMSFTLYPADYKPVIYHTSDQQGFHWIEYQVWNAAANKLAEKIKSDCTGQKLYPVIINTGDMTQNGTRINEWLDYYNGGYNLFSQYEHAAVVGNNDLCDIDPTILGTGDDIGKSNAYFWNLFFCYEIDITKDGNGNYKIPLPICHGKYIPSLYYFNIGQNNRLVMLNSEITAVTCRDWYKATYNGNPVNIYTGFDIAEGDSSVYVADKGDEIGGSFTPIYEMVYAMTADTDYKYIVVCHESPFTVITYASLAPGKITENRSLSGTSLVGCHMNMINNKNTGVGINWLSRLLEFRGIKLCLCGHKHTYACTYPIREYFQFYKDGQWLNSKDNYDKYVMPASLKDEYGTKVVNGETKTGDLINWVWNEELPVYIDGQLSEDKKIVLQNANHTKLPLIAKENKYTTVEISQIFPCTYAQNLTNGVRYFMCQATGYKLTSNKELPSRSQKFSEFIPKTNHQTSDGKITDKPDGNQRRPMFAIIKIDDNNTEYELKLARIENILFDPSDATYKFAFTQSHYNQNDMTLKYLSDNNDGFGEWIADECVLFKY